MATALVLARAGYTVHAGMRTPAASPELASLAAQEKLPLHIHMMDVDSDSSVDDAFARIFAHGPVDVLVNNAGVEHYGSIEEVPLARFRACMETNYFGALRCTQAVVRRMRERGSGVIVNVTSVSGRIASTPLAAYSASKWALEAVSEALAQEMKPFGVRVAVVQPGIIDTRMARNIGGMGDSQFYPNGKRLAALFAASLSQPRPATMVGDKIREIIVTPCATRLDPTPLRSLPGVPP